MKRYVRAGMILAVATLLGLNAWLCAATIGPLRDAVPFDIVFYFPPVSRLLWLSLTSLAIIGLVDRQVTSRMNGSPGGAATAYLAPMALLVLPPMTFAASVLGYYRWMTPWLYLFVDMRGLFFVAVGVIQLAAVDAALGGRLRTRLSAQATRFESGRWLTAALVLLLTAFSWASSPRLRFQSIVVGDEPKYLRFLENWYRGGGFDISDFPPIQALPDDAPHLTRNLVHFAGAVRTVAGALVDDTRRLERTAAGEETSTVTPTAAGNWSVRGVHGGLYQGHHPGSALFLLPGYVIDRYFLNWTNVHQDTVPTNLYATNASVFLIYLTWAVALYRLLVAHTNHRIVSFMVVAAGMMSLPATGFSYQYYAEAAGGCLITLATCYVLFGTSESRVAAFGWGCMAGYLPLMHPRWGPAAAVLAGTMLWNQRRRPSRVVFAFLAGCALFIAAFVLYTYYITGSLMPWTMYEVDPLTPGFSAYRAFRDVSKYWFHWRWGLIAHAPVYLLALPGLVLFARRRPTAALPVALIVLFTAILAASHGWGGSGTTPTRLIAAVVPLLLIPVADAAIAFSGSRLFVAAAVLLATVSVENGFAYNRFFDRSDVAFNPQALSGWKSPLLLVRPAEGAHFDLAFAFWILVSLLGIALPFLRRGRRVPARSWALVSAVVLLVFAGTGTAIDAYTGSVVGWRFQEDQRSVEERVAAAYLESPGRAIWSASRGRVAITDVARNAAAPTMNLYPSLGSTGQDLTLDVAVEGDREAPAWGTAAIDFGDGTAPTEAPLFKHAAFRHVYTRDGDYQVAVQWTRPGAGRTDAVTPIHAVALRPVPTIPDQYARYPQSIDVGNVLVGPEGVEIRCVAPAAMTDERMEWWAWFLTSQNVVRGGALYGTRLAIDQDGTGSLGTLGTLFVAIEPRPSPGDVVRFSVGAQAGRRGNRGRSEVLSFRWPADRLTGGAAVSAPLERVTLTR